MTKPAHVILDVARLQGLGIPQTEIARQVGVAPSSVKRWLAVDLDGLLEERRMLDGAVGPCPVVCAAPRDAYAYLLGMYLGDGWIGEHRRGVYRLRITCCDDYPKVMLECERAMAAVVPMSNVGRLRRKGCHDLSSYSRHWPCLFPQHGPGRKHDRAIVLEPWQTDIVDKYPKELLRGLVHSDGCRVLNRVNGTDYPRYHFSNKSDDIKRIFSDACDRLGISWRRNNAMNLSVARREAVAFMDTFIGPKS